MFATNVVDRLFNFAQLQLKANVATTAIMNKVEPPPLDALEAAEKILGSIEDLMTSFPTWDELTADEAGQQAVAELTFPQRIAVKAAYQRKLQQAEQTGAKKQKTF